VKNILLIPHISICKILSVVRKEVIVIATNLQIDDELIQKAVRLGGHKTKKAAVSKALIEYIQNLEQGKILSMFGTVEYDPEYDYKRQRRRS
jgi:Arc/MetJ family transcription regulator